MLYGALEAGGTKMVLGCFDENGTLLDRTVMPTEAPDITFPKMAAFFAEKKIDALGIGSFGPLCLNPKDPRYGAVGASPKLSWRGFNIVKAFSEALHVPVALDTDVNAAALAEAKLGAAKGLASCVYVTIGTGVGGGVVVDGKPIHGLMHPELGHMLLTPDPRDPKPEGFCPYHKSCLEGLAAGPSMEKRWGLSAKELPDDHVAWEIEANYLAQMCYNVILTLSPEKIILGGGVLQRKHIFPLIRRRTLELLNGYIEELDGSDLSDYIVEPGLDTASGLTGSYLLALQAGV